MATGRDKDSTHLIRRDFRQDHGGGPEEMKGRPKRKAGPWCKKEGRQHRWESYVHYRWTDYQGNVRESHKWRCLSCGKSEWNWPRPAIPSHKHDYRGTRIENNWWDDREVIYEYCTVCNKRGRSYRY